MNDKDCIRIVLAREMIITQTYENRQWAFRTSVNKDAFSALIHEGCPMTRPHSQRTVPLGRIRAGDPEQPQKDW